MVVKYIKPASLSEAEKVLASDPRARLLAGGTQILSNEFRDIPFVAVNAADILPRGIERTPERVLRIGAGATFQDLVDSPLVPDTLKEAALGMASRNVRNAATVGGNLGADKSCSSLIPVFRALDARVRVHGKNESLSVFDWLSERNGIVTYAEIAESPGLRAAYRRWSRTSFDLAVLSCCAAYRLEDGKIRDLRIACGGLDARSRRFPELETVFEGKPLPDRDAAVAAIRPLLKPRDDLRGSAAFKGLRAAELITEALLAAGGEDL